MSLLSLCMIVKNEERNLRRCLDSVQGVVDEIIVVDTGSTDASISIAQSYNARVYQLDWPGDFAAARNYSLEQATGDWILCLDADEELNREDAEKIKDLINDHSNHGYYVKLINYFGPSRESDFVIDAVCRLFRNNPGYRFRGILHEEIAGSILNASPPGRIIPAEIHIYHYGYAGSKGLLNQKNRRNIEILLKEIDKNATSVFFRYALGTEYFQVGEYEQAWEHYKQALQAKDARPYSDLFTKSTVCLFELGKYRETLGLLEDGLKLYPDFTELVYLRGLAFVYLKNYEEAAKSFEQCLAMGDPPWEKYTFSQGIGSYRAACALAAVLRQLGRDDKALEIYLGALNNPGGFQIVILPLTDLLVKMLGPEKASLYIEEKIFLNNAWAYLAVAESFILCGCPDQCAIFLQKARLLPGDIADERDYFEMARIYFRRALFQFNERLRSQPGERNLAELVSNLEKSFIIKGSF